MGFSLASPSKVIDRVVFHIGTGKTGTTAIQESLVEANELLLARGVLYPRAGRVGATHVPLFADLMDPGAPVVSRVSHVSFVEEARASRASTVVVSSEFFTFWRSSRPAEWALALCEALQPRRVDVVGYVRPQWAYIESLYTQLVKIGTIRVPFDAYVEDSLATRTRFDYMTVFGPWREAFGERLDVRAYAAELLVAHNVVDDFWEVLDLGPAPGVGDREVNRRPGVITTEMLRSLGGILSDHHLDELVEIEAVVPDDLAGHFGISRTLNRAQEWIEAALPDDPRSSRLTPEMLTRIGERFLLSNEEFVRDFFRGRHGSFFSPPSGLDARASTWSLGEASERERRLFAGVVAKTLRELSTGLPSC